MPGSRQHPRDISQDAGLVIRPACGAHQLAGLRGLAEPADGRAPAGNGHDAADEAMTGDRRIRPKGGLSHMTSASTSSATSEFSSLNSLIRGVHTAAVTSSVIPPSR